MKQDTALANSPDGTILKIENPPIYETQAVATKGPSDSDTGSARQPSKVEFRHQSKNVAVSEWRNRLRRIVNKSVRGKVGSIIFWDFLGSRFDETIWPEFYRSISDTEKEVDTEEVIVGLIEVGWPPRMARSRIVGQGKGKW